MFVSLYTTDLCNQIRFVGVLLLITRPCASQMGIYSNSVTYEHHYAHNGDILPSKATNPVVVSCYLSFTLTFSTHWGAQIWSKKSTSVAYIHVCIRICTHVLFDWSLNYDNTCIQCAFVVAAGLTRWYSLQGCLSRPILGYLCNWWRDTISGK